MVLVLGTFLGFFSVAFGAYAEHGLRPVITEEQFRYLMTAIRYNQVNAGVTTAIGLTLLSGMGAAKPPALQWSGRLFILGTMLFSFSIYLSVVLGIRELTYLTPVGGVTLMAAWVALALAGVSMMKNRPEP
ncbi:DUF423 domain-containing protein [Roseibium sp.]|uniref:DUF423 domain-containing protein n=1 Tax=Roseibium sp. TaxID=1936156 RepID=UPI003D0F3357